MAIKEKLKKSLAQMIWLRYHKAFQIIVSGGIIITTFLSVSFPGWEVHAMSIGALTNLIWLWEPRGTL